MSLVYKHTNIVNGSSYIGRTKFTIEKRFEGHIQSANKGSDFDFHKGLRKFGKANFISEILEDNLNDNIGEREKVWIKYYDTFNNGYNMNDGGSNGLISEKAKKKFSETLREVEENGLTRAKNNARNRVNDMLNKKPKAYIEIGRKSSLTQKTNGTSKGENNPNFNRKNIILLNQDGDIVDTFIFSEIKDLPENLPTRRMIEWCLRNKKPMYLSNKPRIETGYDFKGWYACYENEIWTKIDVNIRDTSDKEARKVYIYEIYNKDSKLVDIVSNKLLKQYCEEHSMMLNQFQYSYRQNKKIRTGNHKNWYCIKKLKEI